jgi:glutamyl-tRNA reductase
LFGMSLVLTGLSHHTSPIELRERLAFGERALPGALLQLRKALAGGGVAVLSTCNRVEVYAHQDGAVEDLHAVIREFLGAWHGVPVEEMQPHLYEQSERDVVGHLFRVASGLDSMVVGEQQILGQVHDAFLAAQAEQTTDKVLEQLFQRAFSLAKKVRTQTHIGAGKVSISSVAVDLAASIFSDLAGKTVLVVGSGEMGELTLKHLVARGVMSVMIANRSIERAASLAAHYRGEAIALADFDKHLHRADIVISSTSSGDFVLHKEHFAAALKQRSREPMFVIDIAVPRDVDPAVGELDNVYLYDVDDLQKVADANLEARRAEMELSLELVEQGVTQFMRWLHSLAAEPTIVSMTREANSIRERELAKTLAILPELSERERQEIEALTRRITNSLMHRPLRQLKQEVAQEDPQRILHLVKRLFGLKEGT